MLRKWGVVVVLLSLPAVALASPPVPQGQCTITVQYQTTGGPLSFSGMRDYDGRLGDQTPLGDAPNLAVFNSSGTQIGVLGRRTDSLLLANPNLPPVFGPNETLVSHAVFKIVMMDDFFPDLVDGGSITVVVENIQFDQPVNVVEETFLLHALWMPDQNVMLDNIYFQTSDHYTMTPEFRDFDTFLGRVFFNQPVPNYILDEPRLSVEILGEGTDTLSLRVTFPYELLRNLEETGQDVPEMLPAPFGFLEPMHFHIEYVVADCGDDLDGDAVGDHCDTCGDSNLEERVVIDGCDTGIANEMIGQGCTMADLITECRDGATRHGAFVSCTAGLSNQWMRDELIRANDVGKIQRCAAQAQLSFDRARPNAQPTKTSRRK